MAVFQLSALEVMTVDPNVFSAFKCPGCLKHLHLSDEAPLAAGLGFSCSCGFSEEDPNRLYCTLLPSSLPRAEAPLSAKWFHATSMPDWESWVRSPDNVVHLGTPSAAHARIVELGRRRPSDVFSIFEVSLSPNARLAPYVSEDLNGWPDRSYDLPYEAIRYLNLWEDPGSISLMVSASIITDIKIFDFSSARDLQPLPEAALVG